MSLLSFFWVAIFKDGTKIPQFENGQEHLFKEVLDKKDDLLYFNLTNGKGQLFTIDLKNGRIAYNYLALPYLEDSKEIKNNIRLIFFRRHTVEIGTKDLKEKNHNIEYHLGIQWNDSQDNNRQIVLRINSEGNWYLQG